MRSPDTHLVTIDQAYFTSKGGGNIAVGQHDIGLPPPESVPTKEHQQKKRKIVQYNRDYDSKKYQEVQMLKHTDLSAYEKRVRALDGETFFNLETTLAERFHAKVSRRRDLIEHGRIVSAHTHEPLVEMFERGRMARMQDGSSPHDQMREKAEVIGFAKVDARFTSQTQDKPFSFSPCTEVNSMIISFSKQGGAESVYQHNFYDIFTLKQDERGNRYQTAERFLSSVDEKGYIQKALELDPEYFSQEKYKATQILLGLTEEDEIPLDVYLLANPLLIVPGTTVYKTSDDVHTDLHAERECMAEDIFQRVIRKNKPYGRNYLQTLRESPYDLNKRDVAFNAYLNHADEIVELLQNPHKETIIYEAEDDDTLPMPVDVNRLGRRQVRPVDTACGWSEGATIAVMEGVQQSPFSVLDFAPSKERTLKCVCPFCNKKVEAKIGDGKITCPRGACGKSAPYNC